LVKGSTAMRWMLMGPWPVGAVLIPAGTVISDDGDPLAMPLSGVPTPLPIVAKAMDPAAAEQMLHWHEEGNTIGGWHELHFADGIDHAAIKAKVRHAKRWPNGEPVPQAPASSPEKGASPPSPPPKKRSATKGP
jgi:hypothetical protein